VSESPVQRIAVIGPGGAGKSRLARQLGQTLGIRLILLDQLFWKPGWIPTPPAEWEGLQRRESRTESWIVDGLHESTMHLWIDAADTVIFLDVSPIVSLWRVTRRRLASDNHSELPPGCEPASSHRALVKFLLYQWEYRTRIRAKIVAQLDRRRGEAGIVVLRDAKETEAFLGTLPARGVQRDPA
jgi:adenylate kinase family enzyme